METWEVMFRIEGHLPPRKGAKWLRDELDGVIRRALDRHCPFNGLGVRVTEVKVFFPEEAAETLVSGLLRRAG